MAGPAYGRRHRRIRERWAPIVATGTVRCARGSDCKRAIDGVPGLIAPTDAWDLGHDDRDSSAYRGPEHADCNRATRGRGGTRRRPDEPHPGLID